MFHLVVKTNKISLGGHKWTEKVRREINWKKNSVVEEKVDEVFPKKEPTKKEQFYFYIKNGSVIKHYACLNYLTVKNSK